MNNTIQCIKVKNKFFFVKKDRKQRTLIVPISARFPKKIASKKSTKVKLKF